MYYWRLKFCIIYLALNRGVFEVVLMKNTFETLGVNSLLTIKFPKNYITSSYQRNLPKTTKAIFGHQRAVRIKKTLRSHMVLEKDKQWLYGKLLKYTICTPILTFCNSFGWLHEQSKSLPIKCHNSWPFFIEINAMVAYNLGIEFIIASWKANETYYKFADMESWETPHRWRKRLWSRPDL